MKISTLSKAGITILISIVFFFHPDLKRVGTIIPSIVVCISVPGIIKGDEIMVINGAIVSDLDMMYLESVLQEELSLVMMMRYLYTTLFIFTSI